MSIDVRIVPDVHHPANSSSRAEKELISPPVTLYQEGKCRMGFQDLPDDVIVDILATCGIVRILRMRAVRHLGHQVKAKLTFNPTYEVVQEGV